MLILFIYFAWHEYNKKDQQNNFEAYITDSTYQGIVTDKQLINQMLRIELYDKWYYPPFQQDYISTNLQIGDSIVKLKGKGVVIYKKADLDKISIQRKVQQYYNK